MSQKKYSKIREWSELTQEQFAKELSYKNYHTIERGVNSFTFQTLMKIAKKHNLIITIEKKK